MAGIDAENAWYSFIKRNDLEDLVILGDKGYAGEMLKQELADHGICLMALKRSNSKTNWSKEVLQEHIEEIR